jgi:hypothetical protein
MEWLIIIIVILAAIILLYICYSSKTEINPPSSDEDQLQTNFIRDLNNREYLSFEELKDAVQEDIRKDIRTIFGKQND